MAGYWRLWGNPVFVLLAASIFSVSPANATQISKSDAAEPGLASDTGLPERKPEMRRLRLKHRWTGEQLDTVYKIGAAYQPEAMAQINRFMRDWRCDKAREMGPKLIDRLYELQETAGQHKTITVISAYRSEGYNASLLVAGRNVDPNSHHMYGQAIDVYIPGMKTEQLKQVAEEQQTGGTGYYPFSGPRFVHLDTGPARRWTEMDPAERRKLDLPKRERKPLQLNCTLTMTEALRDVPASDAIASLPEGAAMPEARNVQTASLALHSAEAAALNRASQSRHKIIHKSNSDTEPPCKIGNPPKALNIIIPMAETGQF